MKTRVLRDLPAVVHNVFHSRSAQAGRPGRPTTLPHSESSRVRSPHHVFAIVQAIGWPIWPLIIASVVALALIIERGVALRRAKILPPTLLKDVLALHSRRQITPEVVVRLETSSPLGRVLAAGLRNVRAPRSIAGAAVANVGGHVAHELSRYLSLLGSIGSIAPLLGLLGTVIGMIEIFASQQAGSNPQQLAQGISIALYCTAFGIIVAVPAVMFYRHYKSRIEEYLVAMEDQAQQLLEVLFADRYDAVPK